MNKTKFYTESNSFSTDNSQDVPKWNMEKIFTSFTGDDYQKAIKLYLEDIEFLTQLMEVPILQRDSVSNNKNTLTFNQWLISYITKNNEAGSILESLYAYCYSQYSTDTTNNLFLNELTSIEEKSLLLNEVQIKSRSVIEQHLQDINDFYTSFPQYETYRTFLDEEIETIKHQMSIKEETLAAELQQYSGDAWSRLQEQIISNSIDSETKKTFNELRNDAYNENRNIRKESYYKEINILKNNEIAIAAALNNIKGSTLCLNKRRSWKQALDKSLFSSRLSSSTLNALIESIEESLPFWRDYLKTKAKILGFTELDFFDLFAPLPHDSDEKEKVWTFTEAKEYIIEKFSSFSPNMGAFAKKAFKENWVDAKVRKGKVGGAYCIDFPYFGVSRVLSNFTGCFSDVITLAHELGHAYHHQCVKNLDYSLTKYPMTLAETASIFSETIVMKDLINNAKRYEKAKLIEMHLSDSCQVLVDILCRFYFERSVFEERNNSELTAQDFCRLMTDAQNKSYGEGLSEIKHPYIWAVKCHYYSPDLDFYNFPYAFGLLFSMGLYAKYQLEGKDFYKQYDSILSKTGYLSCEEVCKQAGFDITQKTFWKNGISQFLSELTELKEYVNK